MGSISESYSQISPHLSNNLAFALDMVNVIFGSSSLGRVEYTLYVGGREERDF